MKKYTPVKHLRSIIGPVIKRVIPEKHRLLNDIRKRWDDIAGVVPAFHSWPSSINNTRLIVNVDDSIWLQSLSFLKDELLLGIERNCGRGLNNGIESIRFRLGLIERNEEKKEEMKFKIDPEKLKRIEKTISSVKEPVLRDALRKYFIQSSLEPE